MITVNQSDVGNMNDQGAFTSVTLSGLTPGENTIRMSTSGQTYTVVVTRDPDAVWCEKSAEVRSVLAEATK